MIQEVKTYYCDRVPQDEDIRQALDIVHRDGVLVKLQWYVRYSGTYTAMIAGDSTMADVKKQIPAVYGI